MNAKQTLRAGLGTRVEIELISEDGVVEPMALELVADAAADIDAGRVGISTPLARALVGRAAGSTVAYNQGDIRSLHLIAVAQSEIEPDMDAAARGRAAAEEALRKAERTTAEIFSTTFSSKWGGYDASQLED
jgi:hypothetical protein